MKHVGIIVNPDSGNDIRRLVAYASVVTNWEKANIVRRILLGLDSMGVKEVHMMPEQAGIGRLAQEGLDVSLKVSFLDMKLENTQEDSIHAAKLLTEMGVACIITLGGDGTNRVISKSSKDTPLLPVATGTNNVFCSMVEGTLAGIAAGVAASTDLSLDRLAHRAPRLEIWQGSELLDIALIDVVFLSAEFVGSRAVWDVSSLKEVFLTQTDPGNIGFSSLGGYICPLSAGSGKGLHMVIGNGERKVRAPIAPGLVRWIPIQSHRIFEPEESIAVPLSRCVIALDGEREIKVNEDRRLSIRLNLNGPRVLDLKETLSWASRECLFMEGLIP